MREEKFWHDVATRTLSAIFAAGFIYIFALGAGYISSPTGRSLLSGFLATFGSLIIAFGAGVTLRLIQHKLQPRWPKVNLAVAVFLIGVAVWAVGALTWAIIEAIT